MSRLSQKFYQQDALTLAPLLLGKVLHSKLSNGQVVKHVITETEAYCGEEDLACHASKGLTPRTQVMYGPAGFWYVYLIYGMHHMLNVVCAGEGNPHAVLIRGTHLISGPGRLTKALQINKIYNNISIITSNELWIEDGGKPDIIKSGPRIGIDYAGEIWKNKPWRFWTTQSIWPNDF